jgi:hypothetical protein
MPSSGSYDCELFLTAVRTKAKILDRKTLRSCLRSNLLVKLFLSSRAPFYRDVGAPVVVEGVTEGGIVSVLRFFAAKSALKLSNACGL